MDIAKIKTVLSVAKTQSFSEAAFEISLSQSAVSKHIASVEEELNAQLFVRSKTEKSVKLTSEGEVFIKHAKEIVAAYDRLELALSKAKSERRIPFVVSTIPVPSYGAFSPSALISSFYMHYPEIELKITSIRQDKALDALLKGDIDAAIIRVLIEDKTVLPPESWLYDARIVVDDICENPCLVAVGENHPLADRTELSLRDLKDEKIFLQRPVAKPGTDVPHSNRFNMFKNSCINAGFDPYISPMPDPTSRQGEIAFKLVKRGQGVMVIHVRMQNKIDGVKMIPLKGLGWTAKTIVASRKDANRKSVEKLISTMEELLDL